MRDDLAAEDLPASLRELVDLIGLPATLKIVDAKGGVGLYVPFEMSPEHWLARLIGFEEASKLVAHSGGVEFFVPRALKAMVAVRNRQIREKYSMGKTQAELAREFNLTERHVWTIVHEEATPERQAGLFDGAEGDR